MMDIRNILPLVDEEEEEEEAAPGAGSEQAGAGSAAGVSSTAGGGMLASRSALRAMAPRTSAFLRKFRALNEALVEVIEDYNMVSFVPASCRDVPSLQRLLAACDKAIGFVPTYSRAPAARGSGGGGGGGGEEAEEGEEEGEEEEEEEEEEQEQEDQ